ncbi:MAG: hypothetical protein PVF74_03085, partial [Anaerolineales bacterium]
FIGFKSIPYEDTDVLEWYRRIKFADQFYINEDCEILNTLVREYQITHVIIPSEMSTFSCPHLEEVYADDYYWLYQVNQPTL